MHYPIQLSSQLAPHLRSLRKARGLTQAQLGTLIGVGQVRIAEIEKDPSSISVDQFLRILNALEVTLILQPAEEKAEPAPSPKRAHGVRKPNKGMW